MLLAQRGLQLNSCCSSTLDEVRIMSAREGVEANASSFSENEVTALGIASAPTMSALRIVVMLEQSPRREAEKSSCRHGAERLVRAGQDCLGNATAIRKSNRASSCGLPPRK